ncbi:hypothetical protein Tco_0972081 [Tanacetum coccineum]
MIPVAVDSNMIKCDETEYVAGDSRRSFRPVLIMFAYMVANTSALFKREYRCCIAHAQDDPVLVSDKISGLQKKWKKYLSTSSSRRTIYADFKSIGYLFASDQQNKRSTILKTIVVYSGFLETSANLRLGNEFSKHVISVTGHYQRKLADRSWCRITDAESGLYTQATDLKCVFQMESILANHYEAVYNVRNEGT